MRRLGKRAWFVGTLVTAVVGCLSLITSHRIASDRLLERAIQETTTRHASKDSARGMSSGRYGLRGAVHHIGQVVAHNSVPQNILLIGNNARDAKSPLSLGTAAGQADILMVAHLDESGVTLISIPRDALIAMPNWRVPIPKIKTAFTIGLQESPAKGPGYAMSYASKLTGLPIQQYVATNFNGFIDAVDAVGGLPITIPARIYDPLYSGANLYPGPQTLTGKQALAFVRVRQNQAKNSYRVNDYERQQAEMTVLATLKHKLLDSATNPLKVVKLVNVWQRDVATNLANGDLVSLAMRVTGSPVKSIVLGDEGDSMNLASVPLPGVNFQNRLTGAYYDVLDPEEISRTLAPFGARKPQLGLPPLPKPQAVPVVVYGGSRIVNRLKSFGYPVTQAGSAFTSRPSVYYPPGHMTWGWAVARSLSASNTWVAVGQRQDAVVVSLS